MLKNYKEILEKSRGRVLSLAEDILNAYELSFKAFKDSDISKAIEAKELLRELNSKNSKIDNEIIKTLALFSPEAKDLRVVIAYLKITTELVRIAEYIKTFAKSVKVQISSEFDIKALKDDTVSFQNSTLKSLQAAIKSIELESENDLESLYRRASVEESKCDDILSIIEKNIIQEIYKTPESAGEFVGFLTTLRKLERISDRSVNIVKLAYFAQKGGKLKL